MTSDVYILRPYEKPPLALCPKYNCISDQDTTMYAGCRPRFATYLVEVLNAPNSPIGGTTNCCHPYRILDRGSDLVGNEQLVHPYFIPAS